MATVAFVMDYAFVHILREITSVVSSHVVSPHMLKDVGAVVASIVSTQPLSGPSAL